MFINWNNGSGGAWEIDINKTVNFIQFYYDLALAALIFFSAYFLGFFFVFDVPIQHIRRISVDIFMSSFICRWRDNTIIFCQVHKRWSSGWKLQNNVSKWWCCALWVIVVLFLMRAGVMVMRDKSFLGGIIAKQNKKLN